MRLEAVLLTETFDQFTGLKTLLVLLALLMCPPNVLMYFYIPIV